MRSGITDWHLFGTVLFDPSGAASSVGRRPAFPGVALAAFISLLVLGAATIPRQLAVLQRALGATGNASQDLHYGMMGEGLTRLILVDRLVPSPTLVLSAVVLVLLAEPLLGLARDRRAALWTVAVLGLAPLVAQGIGELVLAYSTTLSARPTPGDAISIGNRFDTGFLLLWSGNSPPPEWLVILDARFNLITLWCVALWAVGLQTLDGAELRGWHVAVPMASLVVGGVITWILAPVVFAAILGRP